MRLRQARQAARTKRSQEGLRLRITAAMRIFSASLKHQWMPRTVAAPPVPKPRISSRESSVPAVQGRDRVPRDPVSRLLIYGSRCRGSSAGMAADTSLHAPKRSRRPRDPSRPGTHPGQPACLHCAARAHLRRSSRLKCAFPSPALRDPDKETPVTRSSQMQGPNSPAGLH